jgi:hypothetical protein
LHPWKAGNVMDVVEPYEAEDFSNTGHRLQQVEGIGIVWLGGFKDVELPVTEELIIIGDQGQVDLDVLLDRQIGKAVSDALTSGLVGDFLPDFGQMVWRVGIVPMRSEFSACAHQVRAAPEQVTGGAHGGGVHIRVREHTPTEQGGNLLRIDLIMLGLAAMDGLHVEGVTQDNGHTLFSTHVGQPVPGEETLDSHNEALTIGRNGLEERFRRGLHIAVQQHVPLLTQDADVHGAGMQVDPTLHWVLIGVESPEVSSSFVSGFSQRQHTPGVC